MTESLLNFEHRSGKHLVMSGNQSELCSQRGFPAQEASTCIPSIEAILDAVAKAFQISVKDLLGGRPRLQINNYPEDVRAARKAALYLCCKLTENSAARIAERFGRKGPAVRHAVKAVEQLVECDADFAGRMAAALRLVESGLHQELSR